MKNPVKMLENKYMRNQIMGILRNWDMILRLTRVSCPWTKLGSVGKAVDEETEFQPREWVCDNPDLRVQG